MKIIQFNIITVDIPMRQSVRHALAERNVARNILVAAHDENGNVGWGECCPRPYVTGETIDSVKQDLTATILPQLLGRELGSFEQATDVLVPLLDSMARNQQAAFCAAELATLDLTGSCFGTSAGMVLGPVQTSQVRYSGGQILFDTVDGLTVDIPMRQSVRHALAERNVARNILADRLAHRNVHGDDANPGQH